MANIMTFGTQKQKITIFGEKSWKYILYFQFFFVYLQCVKKRKRMKKNEIIALIRGSTEKNKKLSLADLSKLNDIANVFFDINRETNEYFYRIKIDDLTDKDFEETILTENEWKLSPDENEILLFIN